MIDTTTVPIRAWHFAQSDRKLRFGDDRIIEVGSRFTCNGDLEMCKNGLHASVSIVDALSYAPGPILSRVVLTGERIIGDDKVVARCREHVAVIDATMILHEFACDCAERVLSRVDNPDPRSVEAVRVKRRWLAGEAGDDELEAARVAAWGAALVGAWVAAWEAARVAVRVAAWYAEWDVERKLHETRLIELVAKAGIEL